MEPFSQFASDRQAVVDRLDRLGGLMQELGALGIDVRDDITRVEAAAGMVRGEVLRVALVGAFSDGKTSVIAAWLGQVMDDMKIDPDESSDRLAIYRPAGLPGQCEIVDTPGLFGDRERTDGEAPVRYEDITRQYISQAHVVLYVVDATNPLKDSHGDVVRWLLRDLRKLEATVFVVNKMDEVADLTEDGLFRPQAAIRRENVVGRLTRYASLAPEEIQALRITCISADPNGRGLGYWFGRPEQYAARSRIDELRSATRDVLAAHVPEVLRAKTGLDVIRDLVARKLKVAQGQLDELRAFEADNRQERARITEDIVRGRTQVRRLAAATYEELQALEAGLLARLRVLEMEDLRAYMEDELGLSGADAGYKLQLRIKEIVDRHGEQAREVTRGIARDIELQLAAGESLVERLGSQALGLAGNALKGVQALPASVVRDGIFAARDLLNQFAGTSIRFLPWEATRLATTLRAWAGPLAAVLQVVSEAWEVHKAREREEALKRQKDAIGALVTEAFKIVYDVLRSDEAVEAIFAPQLGEFEKVIARLSSTAAWIETAQSAVGRVRAGLLALDPVDPPTSGPTRTRA